MELTKFKSEVETLKKFFEIYCQNNHENQNSIEINLQYKGQINTTQLHLCNECLERINYSFQRLLECPHDEKPRCRTCPTPCYGKEEWKQTAKVMRYSGMKLGLKKINNQFKKIFGK